jgi:hypothetical protein
MKIGEHTYIKSKDGVLHIFFHTLLCHSDLNNGKIDIVIDKGGIYKNLFFGDFISEEQIKEFIKLL